MQQEELFAAAIGIQSPWFIESIDLNLEKGELNIEVDFPRGAEFEYIDKETGEIENYKAYDTQIKTWRHMNFFQYRCFLNARIPRVKTKIGNVKQINPPWAGKSSGFTLLFEAFILQLVKQMTVHQVCQSIGTYDSKVWAMLKFYTQEYLKTVDYSKLEKIGLDETSSRKYHNYVTLFVDLEERKTVFVTEGKSKETVAEFVEDLEIHGGNKENIKSVSSDMSPSFIAGIEEYLPKAEIVFDKFHILQIINKAVDSIRKQEVKTNPLLIKSKYVFLKNQENFTEKEKLKYEEINLSKMNIKTFRAMQIRESFQQIYSSQTREEFELLLKKWYFWATHSRIGQIIKVAKTIKSHWSGIISWAEKRISNGILEGFNSLFQAAKAKARGYKRTDTIITIIYLLTGKMDFSKINYYSTTHSLL